jgi:hypothetical protein
MTLLNFIVLMVIADAAPLSMLGGMVLLGLLMGKGVRMPALLVVLNYPVREGETKAHGTPVFGPLSLILLVLLVPLILAGIMLTAIRKYASLLHTPALLISKHMRPTCRTRDDP